MLQLSRRNICRFTNSYVCASCLVTAPPPSIISRRPAVISHHVRPLSTTIACRAAAVSEASDTASKVEPPPPPSKQKKSAAPAKKSRPPKVSDTEHQLKILHGALAALKNVLSTQGVDVAHILRDDQLLAAEPDTIKSKRKPKAKASSEAVPKPKAKASSESVPKPKAKASSESVPEPAKKKKKAKKSVAAAATAPAVGSEKPAEGSTSNKSRRQKRAEKAKLAQGALEEVSAEKQPANLGVSVDEPRTPLGIPSQPKSGSSKNSKKPHKKPERVNGNELSLVPIPTIQPEVPPLSYELDRVLFNPGVYHIQDPRSRVYNFDPYLSQIMPVKEFDFNALKAYVTSSKDKTLITIAKENQKKYTGSTSSMTSMLAHFHYLLSAWRDINIGMLTKRFVPDSLQFTRIMKAPAAIFLHWKDGTYAIDADKEFDTANILSMLGKSMEKLLTLSKDDYERYRHGNSDQITEEERNAAEAYHYTGFQDFMMRSQLDAHDSRVPGTGMFDLKTRAVISIRMDAKGYEKGLGYEIRGRFGQWESFEREYYDMIRSAFLKYSLQVRMGRMDGIFVAFHNTQRIFGFQYIPLSEMDLALHGTSNLELGDQEFMLSLHLLNQVLDRATKKWPERSLRLHFETKQTTTAPFMYIFANPTTSEEIAAVQDANKASIEAFERNILGLVDRVDEDAEEQPTTAVAEEAAEEAFDDPTPSPAQEMDSSAIWQEARQRVEEAIGDDELGLGLVREAIGDALEQSGILGARSLAESREYVDALIEALTGRMPSSQTDVSAAEPSGEENVGYEPEKESTQDIEEELDQSPAATQPTQTPGTNTEESSEVMQSEQLNVEDTTSEGNENGSHIESLPDQSTRDTNDMQHHDHETITEVTNEEPPTTMCENADEKAAELLSNKPDDADEEFDDDDDSEDASEATELESDIEKKESAENVGPSNLEALKSLIMRMARRIDGDNTGVDIDSARDDASKLKDFERILGRLISQSRIEQPEREGEDKGVNQEASPESESITPNGASAGGSQSNEGVAANPQGEEIPQPDAVGKSPPEAKEPEVLGMTLTIKNKLNGAYVTRVQDLLPSQKWSVEYEIEELEESSARRLYHQLKERRRKVFNDDRDKETEWYHMFAGNLAAYTKKGRTYREQELEREKNEPLHVVGSEEPLRWDDVFGKSKSSETSAEASEDKQK